MLLAVEEPRLVSRPPADSRACTACAARLVGLCLIVMVPATFWTAVGALIGEAVGVPLGAPVLAALAVAVGALCLVAALAVLSPGRE